MDCFYKNQVVYVFLLGNWKIPRNEKILRVSPCISKAPLVCYLVSLNKINYFFIIKIWILINDFPEYYFSEILNMFADELCITWQNLAHCIGFFMVKDSSTWPNIIFERYLLKRFQVSFYLYVTGVYLQDSQNFDICIL